MAVHQATSLGALRVKNTFLDVALPQRCDQYFRACRSKSQQPLGARPSEVELAPGFETQQLNRWSCAFFKGQLSADISTAGSHGSVGVQVGGQARRGGERPVEPGASASPVGSQAWPDAAPAGDGCRPASLGSRAHGVSCKPCAFARLPSGCPQGVNCRFCHLPHPEVAKIKLRPCKGKRDRYRKLVSRLAQQIQEEPASLDLHACSLPQSVESNPLLKAKLLSRMEGFAKQTNINHLPMPGNLHEVS